MPCPTSFPPVRCTIVRLQATGPVPATVARPGDALAALIEVGPSDAPAVLLLDICRGDVPRHRQALRVCGPARFAYRLYWHDRPTASSRLVVRVRCGGALLASRSVLLLPGSADAQGRLPPAAHPLPASAATRVVVQEQFQDLLDEPR